MSELPARARREGRRLVRALVIALLPVVALLAGSVAFLLYTEDGTRLLVRSVSALTPSLHLRLAEGTLARGLVLDELRFTTPRQTIAAETVRLRFSPWCLLWATACVEDLHAQRLVVTQHPPQTTETPLLLADTPPPLPQLRLPLGLDIAQGNFDDFTLQLPSRTLQLQQVDLGLVWRGSRLEIDHLHAVWPQGERRWVARLAGVVDTRGDWPLTLSWAFRDAAPQPQLALAGDASGNLRDLQLVAEASAPLPLEGRGRLGVMTPGIPLELDVALAEAVPALYLASARLVGAGSLRDGVLVDLTAGVQPAGGMPLAVTAQGRARLDGVSVNTFHVGGQRTAIDGSAELRWLPEIVAQLSARGRLQQLPLRVAGEVRRADAAWLFNDLRLDIDGARAIVNGRLTTEWQAQAALEAPELGKLRPGLRGRLSGEAQIRGPAADPQIAFTVTAPGLGMRTADTDAPLAWRLRPADWQARGTATRRGLVVDAFSARSGDKGSLQGSARIDWQRGTQVGFDARAADLPLAMFSAQLAGRVSGPLRVSAQFDDGLRALSVEGALQGRLEGEPLQLLANGSWQAPALFDIRGLHLQHGANLLRLAGSHDGRRLQVDGEILAPALADTFAQASGELRATLHASGAPAEPDLSLDLDARNLAYGGFVAGQVGASARIARGLLAPGTAAINWSALQRGSTPLGSGRIDLDGTRDAHRLRLAASWQRNALDMALEGAWQVNGWQGLLASGGLLLRGDNRWELRQQPALQWRPAGQPDAGLRLDPHCWSNGRGRACLTAPLAVGHGGRDGSATGELQHIQLDDLLASLLPLDARLDAPAGLVFDARWRDGRLQRGHVDLRNIRAIPVDAADESGNLQRIGTLDDVRARLDLDARGARLSASLDSDTLGKLRLQAATPDGIDASSASPLAGDLQLRGLRLAPVNAFLFSLRDLRGQLSGDVAINGTLGKPGWNGELQLRDGQFGLTRIPVTLQDIQADLALRNRRVDVSGSFRAAEGGNPATFDGSARLADDGPAGELRVRAGDLAFAAPPWASGTVRGRLDAQLAGQRIDVTGQLQVPQARLDVKRVPVQSVARSRDVVVVRRRDAVAPEAGGFDTWLDISTLLGDDVQFAAFGGTGRLAGDLRVQRTPETALSLTGELRILDGRYEAYGNELALRNATLLFSGPPEQPLVNATAVREINDPAVREVGLRLTGPAQNPDAQLFSTPALPREEAFTWLITGRAPSTSGTLRGDATQAALALGVAQGSALLSKAGEEVGIDNLQLSTQGEGEDTELQVGTNVSRRLYVGYNRRVEDGQDSVLLRLQLTRRLVLQALSGIDSALDLFYNIEFGQPPARADAAAGDTGAPTE